MPNKDSMNTFMVFLSLGGLLSGVAGLVTGTGSETLTKLLPDWVLLWNACLTFGGGIGLLSLLSRWPLNRLLERVAAGFFASILAVYFVAICIADTSFFSPASGVILAVVIACLHRTWGLNKEIRESRRLLRSIGNQPKQE